VSAIQELTAPGMQARVIGTLESVASAAPGIGFVIGGSIAAALSPRAAFVAAGCGIFLIVAIAAPLLGGDWSEDMEGDEVDPAADPIIVELIPAGPERVGSKQERHVQFKPEVEP
jgi:MFS family permease